MQEVGVLLPPQVTSPASVKAAQHSAVRGETGGRGLTCSVQLSAIRQAGAGTDGVGAGVEHFN